MRIVMIVCTILSLTLAAGCAGSAPNCIVNFHEKAGAVKTN